MLTLARALAALLALSLVACAEGGALPPSAHLVYAPAEWTPANLESLHEAVAAWQARGVYVEAHAAEPGEQTTIRVRSLGPVTTGSTTDTGHVTINPQIKGAVLVHAVEHEIGHVLGMHHVEAGLMQSFTDPAHPVWWSADDETECTRAGACI